MRICAVADLHGFLPEIPACDLLLIAGDICPATDHSLFFQIEWLATEFRAWLSRRTMPVVAIWGNHDLIGEHAPELVPRLPWTLLQDSATEFGGLKIYGSPWQLRFFDWAFNLDEPELAQKWALIPEDTDILLLHGPPYGFGDWVGRGKHEGSPSLRERIFQVRPKLAVFGHIHEGRGRWFEDGVMLANVTLMDEAYRPVHEPAMFELT
ncbi:MAG TPA: metallophosphoesterase [Gemmataceae bacterium]|nr:metallophosphoesterase [Gemmataceae bacterium]